MMMKIIFPLILLSNIGLSLASEDRISLCEKEGEKYGNGLGLNVIPTECFELFRKAASLEAIKTSESGKILVFGHRNIIFIKQNEKTHVLAGRYTELDEVMAVAIDEPNKEIAVLDKKGDVLFFPLQIPGNVAPYRVLKHKDLNGATDLVINSRKNEVIIFNKSTESLLFFSRQANYFGRENQKKLTILRIIRNLVGCEGITIDGEHQELFTLDTIKNTIQVFALQNSTQALVPVRVMLAPSSSKHPRKIEYSVVTDAIITTNPLGESATLARLPFKN